jgi:hypothetical protein
LIRHLRQVVGFRLSHTLSERRERARGSYNLREGKLLQS